jgi:thiamine-phosphate pyrophosphorylase
MHAVIGFSTHNLSQVKVASTLVADYVAFGPIFDTHTKRDHDPVVGLSHLREVKALSGEMPLVAIGGITAANFASVLDGGADSIAVISDLLKEPNKIGENLRRLLSDLPD